MTLSPELTLRLEEAKERQNDYLPNEKTSRLIGDKVLIMLVGPAAIGKTHIMRQVTEIDSEFGLTPVFTTREPRPDDDTSLFRYAPHDESHVAEVLQEIEQRNPVQYAVHPTSNRLYGSNHDDYPQKYNMLATLSGAVKGMRKLPFNDTVAVGLVTDASVWAYRFAERYPTLTDERAKRRAEAIMSLEWMLDQTPDDIVWVNNKPGKAEAAAQSVIDVARHGKALYDGRAQTERMLVAAKSLGS